MILDSLESGENLGILPDLTLTFLFILAKVNVVLLVLDGSTESVQLCEK